MYLYLKLFFKKTNVKNKRILLSCFMAVVNTFGRMKKKDLTMLDRLFWRNNKIHVGPKRDSKPSCFNDSLYKQLQMQVKRCVKRERSWINYLADQVQRASVVGDLRNHL